MQQKNLQRDLKTKERQLQHCFLTQETDTTVQHFLRKQRRASTKNIKRQKLAYVSEIDLHDFGRRAGKLKKN